ncbi:unnamed protein product [Adineta steineri]|uniref:CAP-Gly domain-containing protein n=1 Tax=Adineta steineri TaxID=433720 RepID=A0A813YSH0_9BILA|nr:unnamed protein product [Adineta steineri]
MRLVASERKSFLPLRLRPTTDIVGPRSTVPMPIVTETNNKPSLTVGSRVLVNGLKGGTLRYIGVVKFAQGIFCGVELDEPDGKHDGEVKDVRYFQCPSNHGVFVPHDKVICAPRARASSQQRAVSRLKRPTLTRSITLTSSVNKIDQSKSVQLPDIVPTPTSTQPVTFDEPIVNDNHENILLTVEQPKEETIIKVEQQSIAIDEPPETIEVDFTDSVSLILHQLQQEQQQIDRQSSSITISEEETDEETDELDNESVVESTTNEQLNRTRQSSVSSVLIPIELTKFAQTDLTFDSNDNISFTKIDKPKINKKDERINITKKPSAIQHIKKTVERRPIPPPTTTKRPVTNIVPRKPSIIPARKGSIPKLKLNSAQSITSLTSQSKQSLSFSSSNSLNSSQSDLASVTKSSNTQNTLIKLEESQNNLHKLEQQLIIEKNLNQSLQTNNQHLKNSYQYLLKKFDLMHIFSQYYIDENKHIQQQHESQLSKVRIKNDQLKTSIQHLQLSHKNELTALDKQHQNRIEILNKTHEQQLNESQQKLNDLLNEKSQVDSHCLLLQEKVNGFVTAMENSEHADVLLCHVDTLEKDRTSLQTVLELKNKEIAQLRTKLHEQENQLIDIKALRKRVDMAENRNQDLEYLLRQKQLSEKAAVVERDVLKEQVTQLERDNCQLKFENETLRYRLRERSFSVSMISDKPARLPHTLISIPSQEERIRDRTYSISTTMLTSHENEHITRSLSSLNCILNR